ncbi:adp ribosylation factor-related [Anaeramoeba ignava]|uniref:Adp ribosylation factor-related n=1 Tax=Anaeramoeba ignava TaxID=1746090 RepID=A0A9Q0LY50_ANAIG|nr:adp ribosylation factor-related [Anaeramoeba ignava]
MNIFICGSNQNNAILYEGTPSKIIYEPINITPIINKISNNDEILQISCGSSITVLGFKSGKILLWGIPLLTSKPSYQQNQNQKEKEKEKENQIKIKELDVQNKNDKKIIQKRSQFIIPIDNFIDQNIQMISCGTLSLLVLVNGEVFYTNLLFQQNPKKKIDFVHFEFSEKIKSISSGSDFNFVIDSNGNLYSWGSNSNGQLGVGDNESRSKPEIVSNLSNSIKKINGGGYHFIALTKTNQLYSCGKNKNGQLGLGDLNDRNIPTLVELPKDIGKIKNIKCGDVQSIVMNKEGKVYVCGRGRSIGIPEQENQSEFIEIIFPVNVKIANIFANGGYGASYCVFLDSEGKGYSVGVNKFGQLGIEYQNSNEKEIEALNKPIRINISDEYFIRDCGCGWIHSCFIGLQKEESLNSNPNQNSKKIKKQKEIEKREIEEDNRYKKSLGNFWVLPPEQIIQILSLLPRNNIILLTLTSWEFNKIASHNWIWQDIFINQFGKPEKKYLKIINDPKNFDYGWKKAYFSKIYSYDDYVFHPNILSKNNFSKIPKRKFWQKSGEAKVIFFGLDASGKTSILYRLKLGSIVTTIPTVGFNVESLSSSNFFNELTVWDLGGGDKIRPLWRHYYPGTDGFIFVVDSVDNQRMEEAREFFLTFINEPTLAHCVVLILAHKQDLSNAFSPKKIAENFNLYSINRIWGVFPTSIHLKSSLTKAFKWLDYQLYLAKNPKKKK